MSWGKPIVGSLRKDGCVQGYYKVPAASSKVYPVSCKECLKLQEQLAKCILPTPVPPSATTQQVYDTLFTKLGACLGTDARLQALQEICAKTLGGYAPQVTNDQITYLAQTPAVRLSALMENCPTGYAFVEGKGTAASKALKGSIVNTQGFAPSPPP